jgi:hypothetical protein
MPNPKDLDELDRLDRKAVTAFLLETTREGGGEVAEGLEERVADVGDAVFALVSDRRLHDLQWQSSLLNIAREIAVLCRPPTPDAPYPIRQYHAIERRALALIEAIEALPEEHAISPKLWLDVKLLAKWAPRFAELGEYYERSGEKLRQELMEATPGLQIPKDLKAAGMEGPGSHAKPGTKLALVLDTILGAGASLDVEVIPPHERRKLIRPVIVALYGPLSDETLRGRLLDHRRRPSRLAHRGK